PNNIMLMTSGANVGFVRTIPHMLGITLGFAVMVMLIGVGLMGLFHSYPLSHQILKYLSLSYLVYLAAKIALSGKASERKDFKPMSFLQAA
ncbi:lysine transporter LysE, partial [Vibrio vulnificus]